MTLGHLRRILLVTCLVPLHRDNLHKIYFRQHPHKHVLISKTTFLCDSDYTVFHKKRFIFDYSSGISWSIYLILTPVETGMNTPQYHVIYLLNCLMTS